MRIAICGISGLIGNAVANEFRSANDEVIPISRSDLSKGTEHLKNLLEGTSAVVNLAGAPIAKRWTKKWKEEIYSSRVNTTRAIVEAVNQMENPPKEFVSASAVGIYDTISVHDEFSLNYAGDFLSKVCQNWEGEALKLDSKRVRLTIFRLGVVLSKKGGALKQMLLPFKLGLGGPIGSGEQFFPWIHLSDVVRAVSGAVKIPKATGIYNLVAPEILNNRQFTSTLAKTLKRPAIFPVPVWGLKLLFGEGASALSEGQQVIPQRLLADGFDFSFPTLERALRKELNK
ncbi:TIGR01777 family oxidoreductase [Alkalitalea saponilacus]|uniref:TIGR01777 family protein n=1 Tax=Alkalitalea saponilacus TaxID=889453 RepID=A0A1T5H928_9BACT|nr:TIGR01777 family oxidoreductase [Alkalitalea saponilacus]ASB50827.1 TIGR01777 family protein [Alkalitalea saponilacus]SKC17205.1 hypothetical protein SAMN03080601_02150 [Alkalitalea saponilacus]